MPIQERQKNINSPYNFNNPPQTTLNLKEYEKTGKIERENRLQARLEDNSDEIGSRPAHKTEDIKPDSNASQPSVTKLSLLIICCRRCCHLVKSIRFQKVKYLW